MQKIFLVLSLTLSSVFASQLEIYDDETFTLLEQTSDQGGIASSLQKIGVHFEQWETSNTLLSSSSDEEIRDGYHVGIRRLQEMFGFQTVDILKVSPDHPNKRELRLKFLQEHTHDEPEVRFFIEGSGLFYLHVDGCIYAVLCEKGDLISIPAHYRHWFDMGREPFFTAIRFFTRPDGWIPYFTGNPISQILLQLTKS